MYETQLTQAREKYEHDAKIMQERHTIEIERLQTLLKEASNQVEDSNPRAGGLPEMMQKLVVESGQQPLRAAKSDEDIFDKSADDTFSRLSTIPESEAIDNQPGGGNLIDFAEGWFMWNFG